MTPRKRHDQEDAQQEALIAALDALRDMDPVALGRTCYTAIRRTLRQARALPPDPAAYRQWFRAACRHPDGHDYSRSQRALFAQQFNRVGQHWADQGLVETPLVVANYRRRPLGGVADARVHQTLRPVELRRLEETFWCRLTEPAAASTPSSPEAAHWQALCRLTFALIVAGGLAGPGAVAALADLEWQHLRPARQGFIRLPRRGVWLRLYVPPRVQALALLLGAHLPRLRQFRESDLTQPIVPVVEPAADPDPARQRRLRQIHTRFNAWLHDLCQQAGVPVITLATLQQAARPRLAAAYGNVLAAAILSQTVYAPVPDSQADVFATYREPFTLPATPAPLPVARAARAARPSLAPADRGNYHLEELIVRLQDSTPVGPTTTA